MRDPIRNNQTQTHTQTQTRPTRARGGVSRANRYKEWKPDEDSNGSSWSERRAELYDWATSSMPDQHPGMVVTAIVAVRMRNLKPTRENVLEHLRASGREASQIGYRPGGEAA